jgi:hypothetical protein
MKNRTTTSSILSEGLRAWWQDAPRSAVKLIGPHWVVAIATRYDKLARNSLAGVYLASAIILLNWRQALAEFRVAPLVIGVAAGTLGLLADLLGDWLAVLAGGQDRTRITKLQDDIRAGMARLEIVAGEAHQERRTYLTHEFDPDPLVRASIGRLELPNRKVLGPQQAWPQASEEYPPRYDRHPEAAAEIGW